MDEEQLQISDWERLETTEQFEDFLEVDASLATSEQDVNDIVSLCHQKYESDEEIEENESVISMPSYGDAISAISMLRLYISDLH